MVLETTNFKFDIVSPDIDETIYEYLDPVKKVKKIAFEKNKKILEDLKYRNSIVITADTLCLLPNNKTLGKPKNLNESVKMAMQQSGKTIKAITGICICYTQNNKRKYIIKNSQTKVTYAKFSEKQISNTMKRYITTDKASGLGIFIDSPGFSFVEKFEGSYSGALGLPLELVNKILNKIYG